MSHLPSTATCLRVKRATLLALVLSSGLVVGSTMNAEEAAEPNDPVRRGLKWLSSEQQPDGSWTGIRGFKLNKGYVLQREDIHHPGVTALCGLSFLAAGQRPDRGEFAQAIRGATRFILQNVSEFGFVTKDGTGVQSHALAMLFLGEFLIVQPSDEVRVALQQMTDLIVRSQNTEGGWRYAVFGGDADLLVTADVILALRVAKRAGIQVPAVVMKRASGFAGSCRVEQEVDSYWAQDEYYFAEPGAFRYRPGVERSSYALTAAGIICQAGDENGSVERERESLELLRQNYWRLKPKQGHYMHCTGHYFGTIVHAHATAALRTRFQEQLREGLLELQYGDGKWTNDVGPGNAYATAVALISLEAPRELLFVLQSDPE